MKKSDTATTEEEARTATDEEIARVLDAFVARTRSLDLDTVVSMLPAGHQLVASIRGGARPLLNAETLDAFRNCHLPLPAVEEKRPQAFSYAPTAREITLVLDAWCERVRGIPPAGLAVAMGVSESFCQSIVGGWRPKMSSDRLENWAAFVPSPELFPAAAGARDSHSAEAK